MPEEVRVLVVQSILHEAMNGPSFEEVVQHNLYRSIALVEKSVRRNGKPNIVVLPEFFLTGLASTRSHEECIEMGRLIPGPETDVLGEVAREHGMYISGATWERDERWPGRWFNTAFIIGPSGKVELKYRKINEGNYQIGLTDTTPGDVYSPYVELYGQEALWPVLDTEYGTLACMICFDLNFAETAQMLALRGAEIILHPTGEPYGAHREGWEIDRRVRAFENATYVVSANHGGYVGTIRDDRGVKEDAGLMDRRVPRGVTATSRSHGGSVVVDYNGRAIARIDGQGEAVIEAVLDLGALRRARREQAGAVPRLATAPAPLRRLWATGYRRAVGFPLDELLDDPLRQAADGPRHLASVLAGFQGTPLRRNDPEGPSPTVVAYQAAIEFVPTGSPSGSRKDALQRALREAGRHLAVERDRTGAQVAVLPDGWPLSFLPGGPGAPGGPDGLDLMGAEGSALGELARELQMFLVGAVAERSAAAVYRTAFVFDDAGDLVYTHRALEPSTGGYEPPAAPAPLEGADVAASLPVLETRFGTWAVVPGREVASVQSVRLLAYAGAEVVFNPCGDVDASLAEQMDEVRRTRARDNGIYLVAAGHGPRRGGPAPDGAREGSVVCDFHGEVVVADRPGALSASVARLDMAAMRRARGRGAMNFLAQLRPHLYAAMLDPDGSPAGHDGEPSARPEPAPVA